MMDERTIIARDSRVSAMLTNPDLYFHDARQRAWARAVADIAADLDRRARSRRDGRPEPGVPRPAQLRTSGSSVRDC